jgi:uncharacterized protein
MSDAILPELIQAMLKPEFYPHSVQKPIQLIQTHISYVLLTGEYAYKVKKPLNFGFLDYSTLEKRHHFCSEELRLNLRSAAELYLDVLAITQEGDRYALDGDGHVVEYAVKMVQFPQETLLTSLYERGELTTELIVELAKAVARFHKTTYVDDYIRSFGGVSNIRHAFDENYEQTENYIGGPQTQQQFDETKAYTDRFFAERQTLFAKRVEQDCIRECHGDIHLRNICYWRNQLYFFDCIEFNEPFRFVDFMFDIAYIVMDLESWQRYDWSSLFLNTYLEQTGDWEGALVLPMYVLRQSYVRAKVISFLLDDPAVSEAEKQAASAEAARYYTQAWRYTQRGQGHMVMMSGLSGSGKSTAARALALQTGAIHIRSDAVRKHLGGVPLDQRGGAELYTPEMTQKTYDRLLELGILLAQEGYVVILDAKYDRQALRSPVMEQAKAAGMSLDIVACSAPESVLRDRLLNRTGDIADATADLLPSQWLEPYTTAEQSSVTPLDTTHDLIAQLTALIARITPVTR